MQIREARPDDAAALIALARRIYGETSFMLFAPDEFAPDVAEYARRIADVGRREDGVMFVAEEVVGEPGATSPAAVGLLFGMRGTARKTRHGMMLVLGVLRSHWQRGVGAALLRTAEQWAASKGLHRLDLTVQVTNARAIALYERMGFEREGLKRHSLRTADGQWLDEWLMSRLLEAG